MKNVEENVVKKGLCSGCGLCAGISNGCIKMRFNRVGEWNPVISNCRDCGLCASVCPSINKLDTDIFVTYYGDYLRCYAGYSKVGNEREKASSGGLATRILKVLLEEKLVSKVVVVGQSEDPDKLFAPVIVSESAEIDKYAGSKYYPVEFSEIIKYLKSNNEEIAIIGLPCVIRGLRLIQKKYPAIGRKVKYLLGLTCAHNKNKTYTDLLISEAGAKRNEITNVNYRVKKDTKSALEYYFQATSKDGKKSAKVVNEGFTRDLWVKGFFSLSACVHCKDLVSEHADISFMDAWVEPYVSDTRGTSFVIVRNEQLKELLEREFSGNHIFLKPIEEKDVLNAQLEGFLLKKAFKYKEKVRLINGKISNILYSRNKISKKLGVVLLKIVLLIEIKARNKIPMKIYSIFRTVINQMRHYL